MAKHCTVTAKVVGSIEKDTEILNDFFEVIEALDLCCEGSCENGLNVKLFENKSPKYKVPFSLEYAISQLREYMEYCGDFKEINISPIGN